MHKIWGRPRARLYALNRIPTMSLGKQLLDSQMSFLLQQMLGDPACKFTM